MWENILIAIIVVACAFFIGRKMYRQLKGTESGCGCSCTGCDTKNPPKTSIEGSNQHNLPTHKNGCNCLSAKEEE